MEQATFHPIEMDSMEDSELKVLEYDEKQNDDDENSEPECDTTRRLASVRGSIAWPAPAGCEAVGNTAAGDRPAHCQEEECGQDYNTTSYHNQVINTVSSILLIRAISCETVVWRRSSY